MTASARLCLVALALTTCLLNCLKPLAVDDGVYYEYARQIAHHPLDPYGFTLGPGGESANEVLVPAGFMYWWAAIYRLVGESVVGWKLGLAPVCLLFVFSLAALARRFARGLEVPLVALVLLSPAYLPGLNLMLDVPALALGMTALALFLRACDTGSGLLAVAAGVIAGVALETKYTAFVTPALLLLAGLLAGRVRLGLLAAGLAVLLFVGWEVFLAARYGDSHFLIALKQRSAPALEKTKLVLPLVGILGGAAAAVALVSLAGLGASRRTGRVLAGLIVAGYLLVALVPETHATLLPSAKEGRSLLSVNSLVFGSLGLFLFGLSGVVIWRLLSWPGDARSRLLTLLLLGWFVLELGGYFALSPYPAVRRVMGVMLVGTLLAGRLVSLRLGEMPQAIGLVRLAAFTSAAVGLVAFAADFDLYRADERAAAEAVQWVHEQESGAGRTLWYQGTGCFPFYAARNGMRRLDVCGAEPQPGDWLIVPERHYGETFRPEIDPLWREMGRFDTGAALPLRSTCQWGGTVVEHNEGPLVCVVAYQREAGRRVSQAGQGR